MNETQSYSYPSSKTNEKRKCSNGSVAKKLDQCTYVDVIVRGETHVGQLRCGCNVCGAAERWHHCGHGALQFRRRFVEAESAAYFNTRPRGELECLRKCSHRHVACVNVQLVRFQICQEFFLQTNGIGS